jgi:hypothetical protein
VFLALNRERKWFLHEQLETYPYYEDSSSGPDLPFTGNLSMKIFPPGARKLADEKTSAKGDFRPGQKL